ncbi:MAG TPA: arylesterase [Nitrospiria bacterium]|jgi:acyl-CoA thioesterase-1
MKDRFRITQTLIFFCSLLFLWGLTGCDQKKDSLPAVEEHEALFLVKPQENPKTEKKVRTLVAFGNSLTAGLGVESAQNYPSILQEKLNQSGYSYRVVNAGVSGDTTSGGLRRVDWVLRNNPEIVILELGANDGLRGFQLSLTYQNLGSIIDKFQKAGVTVVLAGMKLPRNYGIQYTRGFEKMYQDLSENYNLSLIPFFLEGVVLEPDLTQTDGLHPTEKGYQKVVENIWPVLIPYLAKR